MREHLTIVSHPLVQHKLSLMRDKSTSTASFRQLLREISLLLAYEVTRELPMTTMRLETPLEPMDAPVIDGKKLAQICTAVSGIKNAIVLFFCVRIKLLNVLGIYHETHEPGAATGFGGHLICWCDVINNKARVIVVIRAVHRTRVIIVVRVAVFVHTARIVIIVVEEQIPVVIGALFNQYAQERQASQAFGDWVDGAAVWPVAAPQA